MKSPYYENGPELVPPFKVDVLDNFTIGIKDESSEQGVYDSLEEAAAVAREITLASRKKFDSWDDWFEDGEKALVYDSQGTLAWRIESSEVK